MARRVTAGDWTLAALVRAARRANLVGTPLDIELEVETGLGRGGFAVADVVAAADLVDRSKGVRLAGLWTHFQAVEDRPGTATQV
jgi:alanine racemase